MPFKSKAQQRFMFAAEARGDIPKGTATRWAKETKNIKDLPERVKESEFYLAGVVQAIEDFLKLGRLSAVAPRITRAGKAVIENPQAYERILSDPRRLQQLYAQSLSQVNKPAPPSKSFWARLFGG